ncbi:YAP1-binding protein 1 [Hypoxylon texense]
MPAADWFKLSSELEWGESDETYPRLSYNSSTSELFVQCMPTPLHQSISNVINEEFIAAKGSLSRDLRSRTRLSWGVEQNNFRGRWYDSNKQPDMAIEVCDANGTPKMKWVLETRFSETYERLVDDARLWLEGTSEVAMVVLVKYNETPRYRCPVDLSDDSGNKLEELGVPSDRGDIVYEDVCLEEPFGPATYRGLTWVGQITEVFLEIWARGEDGKAVQHGTRQDLLRTAQMHIPFDNIFPHGYFTAITIDSEIFRSELSVEIKKMAGFRCRELVRNYNKKWGLGWEPSD